MKETIEFDLYGAVQNRKIWLFSGVTYERNVKYGTTKLHSNFLHNKLIYFNSKIWRK